MFVLMKFTLGKEERLKSKKLIGKLYTEGSAIKAYPFRMVYLKVDHISKFPVQVGVSVPKRNFKRAVDRNRIKRLMRECYRLQKDIVYSGTTENYIFMISYIAKDEWKYKDLSSKMKKLLTSFINTTKSENNEE